MAVTVLPMPRSLLMDPPPEAAGSRIGLLSGDDEALPLCSLMLPPLVRRSWTLAAPSAAEGQTHSRLALRQRLQLGCLEKSVRAPQ